MSVSTKTVTVTSPASASTVVSTEIGGVDKFDEAMLEASLLGATGGTLDVYLQQYDGVDWWDYAHFAQLAAGAAAVNYALPITRKSQRTAPIVVGKNGTPALAAAACVGGDFGDRFRIVFVAGAGTSLGAAQTIKVVGTQLSR